MNNKALPPFSFSYTPSIPELMLQIKVSLVVSTYQAGKLVVIGPKDENNLVVLPRSFEKPMGFDLADDRLVLATQDEVITFKNSEELASKYPNKLNVYDKLFLPRSTHYTGRIDIHDIAIAGEKIYAVNTAFSCLCEVDGWNSFDPIWKPFFISDLVAEDRCHLNGLVIEHGKPKYVTALGKTDHLQGWRESIVDGGVLIDVEQNEILLHGLAMPHSPQIVEGELYMLLSATGEIVKVDIENRSYEVIKKLEGFCRGMTFFNDYLFVGMSKLRKNSSTFAKLAFAETAQSAGIKIIHLPSRSLIGEIKFKTSVDEIYDVKIIENSIRPNILNTINPIHKRALEIPGKTFWAKPVEGPIDPIQSPHQHQQLQ